MPRWTTGGGNLFTLRPPMRAAEEGCLIDEWHNLWKPPEASPVVVALQHDARVGPLLSKTVGTPLAGETVDEETLCRELVWAVMRAGDTSLVFSEEAFNQGYDTWLSALTAKTERLDVLAPISLHLDGEIDLGSPLAIVQMDDEQVSACLQMAAIRLPFPARDTAWVTNRAAIHVGFELPRGPMDDFSEEEKGSAFASEKEAYDQADDVVEALRLFKPGRVAIAGRVVLRGHGAMAGGGAQAPRTAESEELALSPAEAASFRVFWDLFRAARQHTALGVVIRRFSYAGERIRPDDEIMDLIAALEALLLSDISERGELRYRTALRGAIFIDDRSELTRREIQRQLRRGYDVRSAVAHGAVPNNEALKSPAGEAVALPAFVRGIEELVRLAVRKAIEAVGAGASWPPDWDALTLERATYP
jgi:hypothetical protein